MESRAQDLISDFFEGISGMDIILWFTIGSLVLGALIKFFRKGIPAVKRWIALLEALVVLPEMKTTLDLVHHEMFPNHGGSMRDAIDSGNRVQQTHDTIIKNIDLRLDKLTDRVDPITLEIPIIQKDLSEVKEIVKDTKTMAETTELRLEEHLSLTEPILKGWERHNKED